MSREVYVYDPVSNSVVPRWQLTRDEQSPGLTIVSDIVPYKSMVNGQMITSRSHHRNHLKQYDMIEVGNEKLTPQAPKPLRGVKEAASRIWHEMGGGA